MTTSSTLRASLQELRDRPEDLIEIILRQAEAIGQLQEQVEDLQKQIPGDGPGAE